jgi:hypothetical protein
MQSKTFGSFFMPRSPSKAIWPLLAIRPSLPIAVPSSHPITLKICNLYFEAAATAAVEAKSVSGGVAESHLQSTAGFSSVLALHVDIHGPPIQVFLEVQVFLVADPMQGLAQF